MKYFLQVGAPFIGINLGPPLFLRRPCGYTLLTFVDVQVYHVKCDKVLWKCFINENSKSSSKYEDTSNFNQICVHSNC